MKSSEGGQHDKLSPFIFIIIMCSSSYSEWLFITTITLILLLRTLEAVELTFELPDAAKSCYHEEIKKGNKTTLEYQVVSGGQYDVDVHVSDPRDKIIYQGVKKQFDTYAFTPEDTGVFTFCFSNEFSTFAHKLVYFDFQVGEEAPLPGTADHLTAMTKMEQSASVVHESLNSVVDHQTHYRLNEAKGRKRAEDLNTRVMWWSIVETLFVITLGIGQVFILKNFFADKKGTVSGHTPLLSMH